MTKCTGCKKPKPDDAFKRCERCRSRHRGYTKRYQSAHADKKNEISRAWKKKHRASASASTRKWLTAHPAHRLHYAAKSRAKRFGIPFDLHVTDIVVPERCPVLGLVLQHGQGKQVDASPSLDRKIPELGYVVGNVLVISQRANRIKNDATPEELAKVLAWLTAAPLAHGRRA